ncbi:putative ATP-dependent RNA helicase ddx46 [Cichlidogyrus casuarinus]|uniref:Probable ATP-dependent RNA helicase DDX46 n=1 Tax=Cichlidogyrus casuarinus TaxID=1844966 RepID=A0ABD2QMJ6_9PLAT
MSNEGEVEVEVVRHGGHTRIGIRPIRDVDLVLEPPKNPSKQSAADLLVGSEGKINLNYTDKRAEQARLDDEMRKRKERIEKWRITRKLQRDAEGAQKAVNEAVQQAKSRSNWTLEDDADDEPDNSSVSDSKTSPDNDEDPLDAFMNTLAKDPAAVLPPEEKKEKTIKKKKRENFVVPKKKAPTVQFAAAMPHRTLPKVDKEKIEALREKLRVEDEKGDLLESALDELNAAIDVEDPGKKGEETLAEALEKLNQRKDKFLAVDHTKMNYKPFKKDFYIEVPELSRMTRDQVKHLRLSLENIRVKGKECPRPIKSWVHCGISAKLLTCLRNSGFEAPTPIQSQAIPAIMSGRDLIGIAKTGSGKTLAFLVPLMRHIELQPPLEGNEGPIGLLIAPTRELALQIFKEARKLGSVLNLRVVCLYGGTGISEQIADLKRGAEIIVCTPGRMIDMLAANGGRVTNLVRTTYVVLDEADRMFDLGFEPQVMRILENCRPDRQTVMFSATFPRLMELLARKALNQPIEIQVGGRSVVCNDVKQNVVLLNEEDKVLKLLELLGLYQSQGSVLVFVEKQEAADELMRVLMKYGYPCLALHGGLDQYDRDSVIIDFKRSNVPLLVATSVAARGLDVADLILVVNFDCPNHYEDYVHRCGRTGRAGKTGFAFTFITPDQERNAGDIVRAFKLADQTVPDDLMAMWTTYKKRLESEGKEVKSSSGFGGRGFQFDEAEAQLSSERRMLQKASLGISDDEEDSGAVDWDTRIEDMFASKKKVSDVSKATFQNPVQATLAAAEANRALVLDPNASSPTALQLAKLNASRLNFNKSDSASLIGSMIKMRTSALASAINKPMLSTQKGGANATPAPPTLTVKESKSLAEQAAERLTAKLGIQKGALDEESGSGLLSDMIRKYEEELEINDFPQNVRWRITSRETMKHISEEFEVGVSVRGIFLPPGRLKQKALAEATSADERPLFLSLEATNERNIGLAKKELSRIIKEELVKLQNSGGSALNRGRYKVL